MKKVVVASLVGIGIYSVFKYQRLKKGASSLHAKIIGVNGLDIGFDKINFRLSIALKNNSDTDLGINTYKLLKLSEINFFNKQNGNYLGTAKTNISEIQIPKKDILVIKDIPTVLPVQNILSNIKLFNKNIEQNLKIVLIFDSLGKRFEVIV
ncbi:conserved protein of unknown function [Tenacibaculum sp. 190130A14a]|uniref:Late embryogenesis abundant protein LEA-2 subgroup domain-containing protein n=1 Tax=Tenacibaculum polynesiense TaxID=3137857 RepID=A0ABP1F4F9_9FLAO